MMESNQWPKILPELTAEQKVISNDFMEYWHKQLSLKTSYKFIENFNHGYVVKHTPKQFHRTLEIGAGLGEHLNYENLSDEQKNNYVALELRENMAAKIKENFPTVTTLLRDCQQELPYADDYFDRIIAIHILEHLPNLPAALAELYRTCNKERGVFSIVIPCEGGLAYGLARRLSAQRIFERRYKQSYNWFISREHLNKPQEIIKEIERYFHVAHQSFFPLIVPVVNLNLCIGMTLRPKAKSEI